MKKFSWSVWMLILMTSISCKTNTEKSESNTKRIAEVPADFQSQLHAGMQAIQAYRENKQADSTKRKELLDAAVIHFEKASQIDSTNQDLCFLLGNAYYLSSSYYRAMNAFEKYKDLNNKKIGNGYTLYLNFHLGYQFKFFKNRFFFEPAIGCSYWPVRTNVPESFKALDKKWPNYFIQPGLHFGYNFDFKKNK